MQFACEFSSNSFSDYIGIGAIAIAKGKSPTGIRGNISVLVKVSMTETVLSIILVTYARDPSGVIATRIGRFPTGIWSISVLVRVLITETVWSNSLVTYTRDPSGVIAIPLG